MSAYCESQLAISEAFFAFNGGAESAAKLASALTAYHDAKLAFDARVLSVSHDMGDENE